MEKWSFKAQKRTRCDIQEAAVYSSEVAAGEAPCSQRVCQVPAVCILHHNPRLQQLALLPGQHAQILVQILVLILILILILSSSAQQTVSDRGVQIRFTKSRVSNAVECLQTPNHAPKQACRHRGLP